MTTSELDSRSIAFSMRKSVENLVISSQDAIGQSISQALSFSGAMANNQSIPENRSISRSPSPSLRTADNSDIVDNDKSSETSILVPCHPAGDSISIGGDIILPVTLRDNPKGSANPNIRISDGTARTKKKSWYNSLYPTYKNKSDDFKRLFKDLPDDERLIVDYSCALQKDILVHGRLYASQNYLCFYASIFGWETSMLLRWRDITAITKEKTALVIPNAILICTDGEKNFLTSFAGRDKAYLMLFRIWQNALMDQHMSSQEIWQWVHSCYGEELGFNSDEEGYARDFPDEMPPPAPDTASEDLLDSSSVEARDADDRPGAPGVNGDAEYREEEGGDTLPTDMSDTTDSEPDNPHNAGDADKCSESHEGKLLLQQEFPFNIDQLFTMIFTNSRFNVELLAARGISNYVQEQWQQRDGLKCRQISYTLGLTSGPIGPKEVQVTEKQVMSASSQPGARYAIASASENAGIPYAEHFAVHAHYCLRRRARARTALALYGHVRYKKTMWPMVKGFLEKNTMSGLEEFSRLLEARLNAEAGALPPGVRKPRRHRRLPVSLQEASVPPPAPRAAALAHAAPRDAWLRALLLLLLLLNLLLLYQLFAPDPPDPHTLHDKVWAERGPQAAQWGRTLQRHAARQRAHLLHWRALLHRTVDHLAQTEQALTRLLESIKPTLERARAAPPDEL